MASTSKSNRWKGKKYNKFVPKPKQEWRVKQPARNWLELPSDLTVSILQRIGVIDILENAQKVCTAWREICKDPAMWRVMYMDRFSCPTESRVWREMFMHAVDRSQGQLVDLTTVGFWDCELLQYVADRSSQLRRLEIVSHLHEMYGNWSEALKKLSLLEELSLAGTKLSQEDIETAGRYCPLLKTLKVTHDEFSLWYDTNEDIALTIGKNLPALTHLELSGIPVENIGLQALLDGCCHLESLDLRHCLYMNLKGDLRKRCSQQIKYLKLPENRLGGYPHTYDILDDSDDEDHVYFDDDDEDEYYGYCEYDDYTPNFDENGSIHFEDLNEWMAFKDMFGI